MNIVTNSVTVAEPTKMASKSVQVVPKASKKYVRRITWNRLAPKVPFGVLLGTNFVDIERMSDKVQWILATCLMDMGKDFASRCADLQIVANKYQKLKIKQESAKIANNP